MTGHDTIAVSTALAAALAAVLLAVLVAAGLFEGTATAEGGAPLPSCAEWTDGCVVCARRPEGLACSMPGIACTRGPVQCLKP